MTSRGESIARASVAGCAFLLLLGYLLKAQCLDGNFNFSAYRDLCYNDLQPLFGIRLFDGSGARVFPYVHGALQDGSLVNGAIEYPVLTGLFMWFTGRFADNGDSFLKVSALALAPFGLIAAYLLARLAGWRSLLWSVAPAIALYAFHNWDLLVVTATVGGIYAWWRGRVIGAAILFGIGAALKMYPLMFVVPLALWVWRRGDRDGALKTFGAGVGTFALVNLPFVIANPSGWWATYGFHSQRTPNFDSIWQVGFPSWTPTTLNVVTLLLTALFASGALLWGLWRARRDAAYPFIEVCAALLAAFLLWNKVHSPQYVLWLLPFFVLVRVHAAWWLAYTVADLAVYVGVFRFFQDLNEGVEGWPETLMEVGVWVRAALLLALFVVFLRGQAAPDPDAAGVRDPRDAPVGGGPVPVAAPS